MKCCACSSVMCGGNGGTSGSAIASTRAGRARRRERSGERPGDPLAKVQVTREPVGSGAGVGGADAVVGERRREIEEGALWIKRIRVGHRALIHQRRPNAHALLDAVPPK